MAKPTSPSGTPAILALRRAEIPHQVHVYRHDPRSDLGYGMEAARALGVDPSQVFKTLMTIGEDSLVSAVLPVTGSLDLRALSQTLGIRRAAMAPVAQAERATGYVVGGISPLGQRRPHRTILDSSAQRFETILVSGGQRGLDIEIAPSDLAALTHATIATIARLDTSY
ncbi:MAG: Cys-tRNA(Pro) deacylase [Micrococcales bacterium]|nr:Cys-tRNA(Pro) deacylase [Micrococcales bacterium]